MLQVKFCPDMIHVQKNKNTEKITEERFLLELQESGINIFHSNDGYTFFENDANLYSGGHGDFYPYMMEQLVMLINKDRKILLLKLKKREQKVLMQ